jgi:hypothetical protein
MTLAELRKHFVGFGITQVGMLSELKNGKPARTVLWFSSNASIVFPHPQRTFIPAASFRF